MDGKKKAEEEEEGTMARKNEKRGEEIPSIANKNLPRKKCAYLMYLFYHNANARRFRLLVESLAALENHT